MFGGRIFWFFTGVIAGVWATFWVKKRLKRVSIQRQIGDRIRSISNDVKSTILESREAIRNNSR